MIKKILRTFLKIRKIIKSQGLVSTIRIYYQIATKGEFWVDMADDKFWYRYDATIFHHVLNSTEKVKKMVDAIPSNIKGVIIDGGANQGLFSFLCAKRFPNNQVIAFEPSLQLLPILKRNLSASNITLVPKALGEKNGNAKFYFSEFSDQISSLKKENVTFYNDDINEYEVELVNLDYFIQSNKIDNISVLKLDVQGYEFEILNSSNSLLSNLEFMILEVIFFDDKVFNLIEIARKYFPNYSLINPLIYGADIIFSKKEFKI